VRRGCLGQEGPAPTSASSAQMGGAAATSWTGLLTRSLWGDIPFPTGPGKALASSSLEPAFFLGCGLPPPPQHGWQAPGLLGPRSSSGARTLEGLGPGPRGRDQHTAHHCGHYLPWCAKMTVTAFCLGTESLGPGRLQLTLPPRRRQGTAGRDSSVALSVGGEGVHSWLLGTLPLWAAGRWPRGSGWSKYPLVKCSEGTAPCRLPCSTPPPPGCKRTHAISSTCSLDPWLSLHCNSSVVHSIFIGKQKATGPQLGDLEPW